MHTHSLHHTRSDAWIAIQLETAYRELCSQGEGCSIQSTWDCSRAGRACGRGGMCAHLVQTGGRSMPTHTHSITQGYGQAPSADETSTAAGRDDGRTLTGSASPNPTVLRQGSCRGAPRWRPSLAGANSAFYCTAQRPSVHGWRKLSVLLGIPTDDVKVEEIPLEAYSKFSTLVHFWRRSTEAQRNIISG